MTRLTIRLFGYPQFQVDGTPLRVERRKTLALAAYLAVETLPPRPGASAACPRETLAALLCPEGSQDQAGAALRQALWDFGKSCGDQWIVRNTQFVYFNPHAQIWVDVLQFEALLAQWKAGVKESGQATAILEQMTTLHQAEFLAGFNLRDSPAFSEWAIIQAERLRQRLQQALEGLVTLYSRQGDHTAAATHALRWQALDPLNETACRAGIRALANSGRRKDALQQYETCKKALSDELGVQPEPETTHLYEQIRSTTFRPNPGRQGASGGFPPGQARPTGTVTFLFTDIEGSTHLWEHQPEAMQRAYARHETILRESMAAHGGYVYKMVGDAFQVAFSTGPAALQAAIAAQSTLNAEEWGEACQIKVRIALHTGVTEERREDYVGPTLNRAARLLSAGHGGQVLLNQTTYELVREHLVGDVTLRDLGIHTLKDLLQPEHIYQAAAPGLPADFPPLRTACAAPASLPVQIAPFVGRQVELARIKALLEDPDCRLISLIGMGGSGKTRLGIQAAGESQAFTDGVFFVGLAQALSLDDLTARLADALKLAIYAPRQQRVSPQEARAQLLNYLAGKQFLLILDNFEQLTSQADFLLELLGAAPGIKLIVTSRERLNLPGESVLPVAGLAFPGRNEGERIPLFASVQLFVDRAGRSGYLTVDGADWTAIARICQLVEGIPLAVEMAAAWVKMLSCQEIAAEIERDLDFLTANWRGMPERHHTFRSVFEHSWRLLPEKERDIFCRLSVFAGGFTREAALEVAGAPLHLLASLCDKSFLRRTASGASGRFEIQPILKQYAAEKLAQQPILLAAVQERYAFYYSDWLERMFEKLKGSEQFSALAALRSQVQDLLNACRWLIHVRDLRRLPRAAIGMILYYEMSDQYVELQDVIRLLGEVLRLLAEPPPGAGTPPAGAAQADLLALVLGALRHFVSKTVSQPEQSYHFQQESLQSARGLPDSQTKAFALLLNLIGPGPLSPDQMLELGQECIAIFERLRDAWGAALAQLVSGDIAIFLKEDPVMAHACYQPSLETFSRLGNDWGRAMCLTGLAQAKRQVGHPETAYDLVRQSLVIYQRINNPERMLLDRHILGEVAEELGEYLEARDCYETNLAYLEYVGDEPRQPHYRNHLADLEKKLADRP